MGVRHWAIAGIPLAMLISCSGEVLPPTGELFVAIESNIAVPAEMDVLRVEVRYQGGLLHGVDYKLADHPLPGTIGIVHGTSSDPVDVRVIGEKGTTAIVLAEARTVVPTDRIAVLALPLSENCRAFTQVGPTGVQSTCTDGNTCRNGSCQPIDIDPGTLPDYTPGQSNFVPDASSVTDSSLIDAADSAIPPDPDFDASPPPTVLQIVLGSRHSCALFKTGSAQCWGTNLNGELGDTTTTARSVPTTVSSLTSGLQMAAGLHTTCVVLATGGHAAQCWGFNASGQLGDGSLVDRVSPSNVSGLINTNVIGSGDAHSCALLIDSTVRCWGDNSKGQVGDGTTAKKIVPTLVTGNPQGTAIATGATHSCVITGTGVKCWGSNTFGELGDGTTTDRLIPVPSNSVSGAVSIAAGGEHTCAIISGGGVRCWGKNSSGELGDGTTTDRPLGVTVAGLSNVRAITASDKGSCALLSLGKVVCWGDNSEGQLGDATLVSHTIPAPVVGLAGVFAIASGHEHTCAILSAGGIRCWGANDNGQLGDGTLTRRTSPTPVVGIN